VPAEVAKALKVQVLDCWIGGFAFSALLNESRLEELGVDNLTTLHMARMRKAWHADFPDSVSIRSDSSPCSPRGMQTAYRHHTPEPWGEPDVNVSVADSYWKDHNMTAYQHHSPSSWEPEIVPMRELLQPEEEPRRSSRFSSSTESDRGYSGYSAFEQGVFPARPPPVHPMIQDVGKLPSPAAHQASVSPDLWNTCRLRSETKHFDVSTSCSSPSSSRAIFPVVLPLAPPVAVSVLDSTGTSTRAIPVGLVVIIVDRLTRKAALHRDMVLKELEDVVPEPLFRELEAVFGRSALTTGTGGAPPAISPALVAVILDRLVRKAEFNHSTAISELEDVLPAFLREELDAVFGHAGPSQGITDSTTSSPQANCSVLTPKVNSCCADDKESQTSVEQLVDYFAQQRSSSSSSVSPRPRTVCKSVPLQDRRSSDCVPTLSAVESANSSDTCSESSNWSCSSRGAVELASHSVSATLDAMAAAPEPPQPTATSRTSVLSETIPAPSQQTPAVVSSPRTVPAQEAPQEKVTTLTSGLLEDLPSPSQQMPAMVSSPWTVPAPETAQENATTLTSVLPEALSAPSQLMQGSAQDSTQEEATMWTSVLPEALSVESSSWPVAAQESPQAKATTLTSVLPEAQPAPPHLVPTIVPSPRPTLTQEPQQVRVTSWTSVPREAPSHLVPSVVSSPRPVLTHESPQAKATTLTSVLPEELSAPLQLVPPMVRRPAPAWLAQVEQMAPNLRSQTADVGRALMIAAMRLEGSDVFPSVQSTATPRRAFVSPTPRNAAFLSKLAVPPPAPPEELQTAAEKHTETHAPLPVTPSVAPLSPRKFAEKQAETQDMIFPSTPRVAPVSPRAIAEKRAETQDVMCPSTPRVAPLSPRVTAEEARCSQPFKAAERSRSVREKKRATTVTKRSPAPERETLCVRRAVTPDFRRLSSRVTAPDDRRLQSGVSECARDRQSSRTGKRSQAGNRVAGRHKSSSRPRQPFAASQGVGPVGAVKSPDSVAAWVRNLPPSHLPDKSRYALADAVIGAGIDSSRFTEIVAKASELARLGVSSPAQAMKVRKNWEQVLREDVCRQFVAESCQRVERRKAVKMVL